MKRFITVTAAAVALGLVGAASFYFARPRVVENAPHRREIAAAQAAVAWKLLAQPTRDPQTAVSPASLASAVSIVALGASPTMKAALMKALSFDALAPDEAEARAALANADRASFITADRFVRPPGMYLSRQMFAEFDRRHIRHVVLDLQTKSGIGAVNAWVKKATRGEIDAILDKPLDAPAAVALNALFFKAKWANRFDPGQTGDGDFHDADGGSGRVRTMHRHGAYAVREAPGFVGVELPFAGERYAMTVVTTTDTPAPLARFAGVSGWLSGEGFAERDVTLSLPRFRLDTSAHLLPALAGDLNEAMASPAPFEGFDRDFRLDDIFQRIRVEVDEDGAKVAAVTAVRMTLVSAPPRPLAVVVDKPFLFALRDRNSGLILAAGYVGKTPKD